MGSSVLTARASPQSGDTGVYQCAVRASPDPRSALRSVGGKIQYRSQLGANETVDSEVLFWGGIRSFRYFFFLLTLPEPPSVEGFLVEVEVKCISTHEGKV